MRKVSDSTRPDSGGDSTGESSNPGDNSEIFANIKSANRKVRLIDILRNYKFKIEKNYQRPAWSNNITCPLPKHKGAHERSASFAYNFVGDFFYCLGCNQGGRAVEFISLYEGLSRTIVAERILSQCGEDIVGEDELDYTDDISPILLDGSKYLQALIQKHKNDPDKMKKIEEVILWLDFYLMKAVPGNNVRPEELKGRLDRMKELI